jgi:hypothetical protein
MPPELTGRLKRTALLLLLEALTVRLERLLDKLVKLFGGDPPLNDDWSIHDWRGLKLGSPAWVAFTDFDRRRAIRDWVSPLPRGGGRPRQSRTPASRRQRVRTASRDGPGSRSSDDDPHELTAALVGGRP